MAGHGWTRSWLDPVMGIVGAILVAIWAKNLIRDIGKVLLDREMDAPMVEEIRDVIKTLDEAQLVDLHVWRVGRGVHSYALSIVTRNPALTAREIREQLAVHEEIVRSKIEVHYLDT